jgi:hypothetical protein
MRGMKLLIGLVLAAATLSAQSFKSELLVGVWKVNWEKSGQPDQGPAAAMPALIREYRPHGDGFCCIPFFVRHQAIKSPNRT